MGQATADLPTLDLLIPLIFDGLPSMASHQLGREHGHVTLQTTELVHEAYLGLGTK